jgi:hypothetical protein
MLNKTKRSSALSSHRTKRLRTYLHASASGVAYMTIAAPAIAQS